MATGPLLNTLYPQVIPYTSDPTDPTPQNFQLQTTWYIPTGYVGHLYWTDDYLNYTREDSVNYIGSQSRQVPRQGDRWYVMQIVPTALAGKH